MINAYPLICQSSKIDSLTSNIKLLDEDSIMAKAMIQLAENYRAVNLDSSLYYFSKSLDLSNKQNYIPGKKAALNGLGVTNAMYGKLDISKEYFLRYLTLSIEINDSLNIASAYQNLGNLANFSAKLDSATFYYKKAQLIFHKTGNQKMSASLWTSIGNLYMSRDMLDSAIHAYNLTLEGDSSSHAIAYYNLGRVYSNKFQYQSAIDVTLKALDLFKKSNQNIYVHYCLDRLGTISKDIEDFEKAISYYKESVSYAYAIGDTLNSAGALTNLGAIYSELGVLDSAKTYLDRSLKLKLRSGKKETLYMTYSYLGKLYHQLGDQQKSQDYFSLSIDEAREAQSASGLIGIYELLTEIHIEERNFSSALNYLNKSREISKGSGFPPNSKWHYNYYLVNKAINKLPRALFGMERYFVMEDSIRDIKKTGEVNDILVKYETEQKELENLKLRNDLQNELFLKERSRLRSNAIIIASIMLLVILAITIMFYMRERKSRRRIDLLNREIHHRTKNNLGIIKRLIEVSLKKEASEDNTNILNLRNRIESFVILHDDLYKQRDIEKVKLSEYISEIGKKVSETFHNPAESISFAIQGEIKASADQSFSIGLIVNEALTNSYKYAFQGNNTGHIEVSLQNHNNQNEIVISDNGQGIPDILDLKNPKSYGLKLISGLTKQLNGKVEITSLSSGTIIKIQFPNHG